jgi:hypothetical protein
MPTTINLPPDGGRGGAKTPVPGAVSVSITGAPETVAIFPTTAVANKDTLTFKHFDNGYLARFADGFFNPDIPDGMVTADISVAAIKSGTVIVGFLDNNRLCIIPIQITP